MNFSSHLDHTADEQASLWAARLDGSSLSGSDRNALDAWLAESPVHRTLLARYCQFSTDLEQQLPALAAAGILAAPPSGTRRRRLRAWALGAGLAAAAAAVLVLWLAQPRTQAEAVATPAAQRRTLTLIDGTHIELNARTSLQVEIDGDSRRVRLAAGEAFFVVAHDPSRPFVVETPAGSVRVTGTQFDIRTDSSTDFRVTVVKGTVQAHPNTTDGRSGAPLPLTAGDQLSTGPAGVRVRVLSATALDDALAWRQGQIVFHDVPLREALARFARYHGCGITVTPAAGKLAIGGRYALDDLDGFLRAIEDMEPVRVSRDLNGTVQVSLRSER